jgi:cell division protein FtsA
VKRFLKWRKDSVEKAGYDISMPAGIVLTGGTSLLRDITKVAQDVFGVASRVGYPSGLSGMTERYLIRLLHVFRD